MPPEPSRARTPHTIRRRVELAIAGPRVSSARPLLSLPDTSRQLDLAILDSRRATFDSLSRTADSAPSSRKTASGSDSALEVARRGIAGPSREEWPAGLWASAAVHQPVQRFRKGFEQAAWCAPSGSPGWKGQTSFTLHCGDIGREPGSEGDNLRRQGASARRCGSQPRLRSPPVLRT